MVLPSLGYEAFITAISAPLTFGLWLIIYVIGGLFIAFSAIYAIIFAIIGLYAYMNSGGITRPFAVFQAFGEGLFNFHVIIFTAIWEGLKLSVEVADAGLNFIAELIPG